jgi:hypothetical protein
MVLGVLCASRRYVELILIDAGSTDDTQRITAARACCARPSSIRPRR